jgi:ABC-type antimicrobial peptide transport system permease subunit
MFLLEAAEIGVIGGIVGNILSFLLSMAINAITQSAGGDMMTGVTKISVIPPYLALTGLLIAAAVGLVSGFFPARRAMKLSPLQAIQTS